MLEAASKTATDLIMKRVVSNYYEIDDLGDIFNQKEDKSKNLKTKSPVENNRSNDKNFISSPNHNNIEQQ